MDFRTLLQGQRDYFSSGRTKDIDFRLEKLEKLEAIIKENEEKIYFALEKDLDKSAFESYMTEVAWF